jgi:CHAD domain-containing protein
MADGKWIDGLSGDLLLADAARRVLEIRMQVVGDGLPFAVCEAEHDPEHVHQLRVATRRADAAVRIFASCLPEKTYRCVRRRLRLIRRAAGAARDWDVFLEHLLARRKTHPAREHPGLDFLAGYALGQRHAAQPQLVSVGPEQMPGFEDFVAHALEALRPPTDGGVGHPKLVNLARPMLSSLICRLEEAVRRDLTDYEQLHQVRIEGKRLRYAMEVFADCFAPEFRGEIYPLVEQMQSILGEANDSHVASQRLLHLRSTLRSAQPDHWRLVQPGVESLLRYQQRRLPQERRRFLKWWGNWQVEGLVRLRNILQWTPAAAPA